MRSKCFAATLFVSSSFFAGPTIAATAVYQPENGLGSLYVQGFNGPMQLPVVQDDPAPDNAVGAAASNSDLYGLFSISSPANTSAVYINNAQTGAYEGSISINAPLADIAYTNGQLYGLQVNSTSIQIDSISNTGTLTPVITQSTTTPSGATWRLSGAVNGNSLLATALPVFTSPTTAFVINPAASQISPFTFGSGAQTPVINADTVINLAGNVVTLNSLGGQAQYAYPSGTFQTQTGPLGIYPAASVVSDEFTYNYPASDPAYTGFALVTSGGSSSGPFSPGYDGLIRALSSFTVQMQLENGAAPDGTTLSNVGVAAGQQLMIQQSGPSPLQISETPAAPGSFSARIVSTDTISLSPGAERAVYEFGPAPNALVADYTYGATTDIGRAVSYPTGYFQFAYDPISSNLVGNGDFTLGTAGWEANNFYSLSGSQYGNGSVSVGNGKVALQPNPQSSYAVRQLLQLPTADEPMLLSFDYNAFSELPPASESSVELQVYLGNTLVGSLSADSTATQQDQITITNPALENLNGAYLTFVASGNQGNGIALTDISLTAVPEPASLGLLFTGLAFARRPRRRRG